MDWYSRYVLSWGLSITLEKEFCIQALENALGISKPEIFNTDQGGQFTSEGFTGLLAKAEIRISMDGRSRLFDNILVERHWRTVKYEEVYLHDYRTVLEAREQLAAYFRFYNTERLHETLGYRTPHEVYFGTPAVQVMAPSTGFDMDRFEIVVFRSNGEAVFSVFLQKMVFGLKKE